jgi:hypothetical protein
MRVAKVIIKGESHIVELKKVEPVLFAEGIWALIEDLDRPWHDKQLRWVPFTPTLIVWVREFQS